jgi:hypothetical protein
MYKLRLEIFGVIPESRTGYILNRESEANSLSLRTRGTYSVSIRLVVWKMGSGRVCR